VNRGSQPKTGFSGSLFKSGAKLMTVADGNGFPLAIHTASATPHEVAFVRQCSLILVRGKWQEALFLCATSTESD
jgi:hypothetical protein